MDLQDFINVYNRELEGYPSHFNTESNEIITWLESQTTAKAMTYLAICYVQSPKFDFYINEAIKLDSEFIPAYLTWFMFSSIKNTGENEKFIQYGEKILASNLCTGYHEQIYEELVFNYEEIKDYINSARYAMRVMQKNEKFYLNKIQGPNITIEMAKEIFRPEDNLNSFDLIYKLLQENEQMKREIKTLRAFPGGPDYIEALANFTKLQKN